MLKFDEELARLLEISYQGADITRRRQASFDALHPDAGDVIADIGCGNGLLTLELARAVGPNGKVIGIDPSEDMRKPATQRCGDLECVEIVDGNIYALPLEPGSIDKAVSVQVFEYLDDIPGAVNEAHRVLKSGGKLVIGDIHFDSLIWFSDDSERMNRMVEAWNHHFTNGRVPALLPHIMHEAGFAVEEVKPVTICDYTLKPDGLANMMMHLMPGFAADNNYLPRAETQAWLEEQKSLAESGRFFFSLTHFVVSGRKNQV